MREVRIFTVLIIALIMNLTGCSIKNNSIINNGEKNQVSSNQDMSSETDNNDTLSKDNAIESDNKEKKGKSYEGKASENNHEGKNEKSESNESRITAEQGKEIIKQQDKNYPKDCDLDITEDFKPEQFGIEEETYAYYCESENALSAIYMIGVKSKNIYKGPSNGDPYFDLIKDGKAVKRYNLVDKTNNQMQLDGSQKAL